MAKTQYYVPVGPIHPALKEPIRVEAKVEGEKIVEVDVKRGFAHRGIEYMGMKRNAIQTLYLSERICGICSISHPYAFVIGSEKALGIEAPPRAQYIRTIIGELERIHSHILWLGVVAHEMGFDSLLFWTWKGREKVLDILELLTGNRINYSVFMIGGVRRDIKESHVKALKDMISYYRIFNEEMKEVFLSDPVYKARTRGVAQLSKKMALELNAVGPVARAAGVRMDVRQDIPYDAYADIGVRAVVPQDIVGEARGDAYDITMVRLYEIDQSLDIIEYCLEEMPEGKIMAIPNYVALLAKIRRTQGEAIGAHEAPRGEVIHYFKYGNKRDGPVVWKVIAPSYNNINTWKPLLLGAEVADIPIVVAYIDPCMCCNDRVAVVRDEDGRIIDPATLHRKAVEKTRKLREELGVRE
ncbi:hydrogenase large subunit [Thermococcus camini]|uniref:Membrane-bound hydrogenase subunit alpha n=1 Tax=Thermococcus camini TaxID=2016373 RepID=A0A7G2D9T1_9EURY|nr:nickel-dependent hydrogenase large subunit [Thermococcus camini]CAD5245251.1 Membrane-bound hydrogenase subunit alpha [Thermococcus camini]